MIAVEKYTDSETKMIENHQSTLNSSNIIDSRLSNPCSGIDWRNKSR